MKPTPVIFILLVNMASVKTAHCWWYAWYVETYQINQLTQQKSVYL